MQTYKGRQVFMETLLSHGVEYIFGNPGTTEMPIMDSLLEYPSLEYILTLQESITVGVAHYYAQASGRTGRRQRACGARSRQRLGHALQRLGGQHADAHDRRPTRYASALARASPRSRPGRDGRASHQMERGGGDRRRDGPDPPSGVQDRQRAAGGPRFRGAADRRDGAGHRDRTGGAKSSLPAIRARSGGGRGGGGSAALGVATGDHRW